MNASYLDNYKFVIRGDSYYSETLLEFAQAEIKKKSPQSILELGCDQGLLLEKLSASQKIGIDISEEAIRKAKLKYPGMIFHAQNALSSWKEKADLIIDSHLFHCLVFKEERLRYLRNMKESLNPGGKILIECMGEPAEENFEHLLLNEAGQIWAETKNGDLLGKIEMNGRFYIPFRFAFDDRCEEEIKQSGLSIESLFYSPHEFEFTIMGETLNAPLVRLVLR